MIKVCNPNTKGITASCLEIHDLLIAKLTAGREKDLNFFRAMIKTELINKETLLERWKMTEFKESSERLRTILKDRIEQGFSNHCKDQVFLMNAQEQLNQRSIEYGKAIVLKLEHDRRLWQVPLQNLKRWKAARNGELAPSLLEWETILSSEPRHKIMAILVGTDENSMRLRSSSPFTGILTHEERREILTRTPITYQDVKIHL